jgi:hypothetical protein
MKVIRLGLITLSVLSASCFGVLGREAYGPLSASAAQRRLVAHVSTWSTDPGVNAGNVAHHYATRTIYYGKLMSRHQVLLDKLRYIAVWPSRRYSIIPSTVSVRCNRQSTVCQVSGIMQWDRRSRRGERSIGRARLSLTLSGTSGGKIVRESAVITM